MAAMGDVDRSGERADSHRRRFEQALRVNRPPSALSFATSSSFPATQCSVRLSKKIESATLKWHSSQHLKLGNAIAIATHLIDKGDFSCAA